MTESVVARVVCPNHPAVETGLRCNRCDKPICQRCAVRTPVGYRCRECVHGQQRGFETAVWHDYVVASAIAGGLSWLAGNLLMFLSWFGLLLAAPAGALIATTVLRAISKRRSRRLNQAATAAFVAVHIPGLVCYAGAGNWFGVLILVAFVVLAAGTFLAQLRGMVFRR